MALVPCRECGKEVSEAAETCPNCGIRTPSKKRRQLILARNLIILLAVVGLCVWIYLRVAAAFAPPVALDANGKPIETLQPKLQKTMPVKEQILQKDYKDKVKELMDSDKSLNEISTQTGMSKKELRKIKREKKKAEKSNE